MPASQINAYLRNAAPNPQSVGQFVVTLDSTSDLIFRNYAIPTDNAAPTEIQLNELTDYFFAHNRLPRLEYVPAAAPALEAILLEAGFAVEGHLPLMICNETQHCPLPPPNGIEMIPATTRELLRQVADVQNEAYSGPPTTDADVERLFRTLSLGGGVMLARECETGIPTGAGLFSPPFNGITEIAAMGVVTAFRRRGIAAALTSALTGQALQAGAITVFLMAVTATEERIYARAGFQTRSEVLHISCLTPRLTPPAAH